MRVAIAGSNGLACSIADAITTNTYHQIIILSRAPKPQLSARGWQVVVVNYDEYHRQELAFKLAGVSVVLSVISGPAQIALIDAAAQAGVRRFAPAEFEGPAALRPQQDALDRGKWAALERLQYYQTRGMQYTSFVCGILYERFAPGGMYASRIGLRSGIGAEGDYLMNITQKKAQLPFGTNGQPAIVSLTSAEDVGKFVAAAISLPQWPPELRMRGDRMNVSSLVQVAEMVRGAGFEKAQYNTQGMQSALQHARSAQNIQQQLRVITLMATASGRFDFASPNLNALVAVTPTRFQAWLQEAWKDR
ncbi:MAG: hypothetical protein L6R38_003572 [Xanthoria sp. 2 TBL-2021]|nr:MAG: hypothetical protein L6R38_003572 [Xanthoria sp. 2 TBL-2021]